MRKTISMYLVASAAAMAFAACGGGEGSEGSATMRPGDNCLACHSSGGAASEKAFTAAGTVYASPDAPSDAGIEGALVVLTDANGKVLTLTSNSVGNFYTSESLAFPLRAEVRDGNSVQRMPIAITNGGCSSCHNQPPASGAPGRLFVAP